MFRWCSNQFHKGLRWKRPYFLTKKILCDRFPTTQASGWSTADETDTHSFNIVISMAVPNRWLSVFHQIWIIGPTIENYLSSQPTMKDGHGCPLCNTQYHLGKFLMHSWIVQQSIVGPTIHTEYEYWTK